MGDARLFRNVNLGRGEVKKKLNGGRLFISLERDPHIDGVPKDYGGARAGNQMVA